MNSKAIAISNLCAGYGAGEVLHNLSLDLFENEVISIVGRNGAGKTTLLRTIAGLLPMRAGSKKLFAQDCTHMQPHQISRTGLAYVPEDRQIFASLTVVQNLQLGAYAHDLSNWNIERVFALFPRLRQRSSALGGALSGGEQQMLALGRALMSDPKILLLDEPTEGLAPIIVDQLVESLKEIIDAGVASILVEQNLKVPRRLATRHMVIDSGMIVWTGSTDALDEDIDSIHRILTM